jgi:hypothetical protein
MRHRLGLIAAVLAASAAGPARAQEPGPQFWPLREINFPVSLEKVRELHPRTAKVRFYVARDRGRFERVAERALSDLDVIDAARDSRGFRYTAPADGEYAFSIQLVYADGEVNPRDADLTAHRRVVIDTHPPQVRIAAAGTSGVEWDVSDEYAKRDGVELQVRYRGTQQWTTVTPRAFGLRDRYTWEGLSAQQPIEVRVVARDRTGHEGVSVPPFVTLPAGRSAPGLDPVRPTSDRTGAGFGNPDDFPTRPEISYVSSRDLTVESKLTRVTRSGIGKVHLWINDGKSGWKLAKSQPEDIAATDGDPTVRIRHTVEKDGLYGFIVIPENKAGGRQDDPRPGDPAQFLIEVDTDLPSINGDGAQGLPRRDGRAAGRDRVEGGGQEPLGGADHAGVLDRQDPVAAGHLRQAAQQRPVRLGGRGQEPVAGVRPGDRHRQGVQPVGARLREGNPDRPGEAGRGDREGARRRRVVTNGARLAPAGG